MRLGQLLMVLLFGLSILISNAQEPKKKNKTRQIIPIDKFEPDTLFFSRVDSIQSILDSLNKKKK